MPYDPVSPLEVQIRTSVESSLMNLRASDDNGDSQYLDCLLLHSPLPTIEQTLQAWELLESYVPASIKNLGISNVTLPILKTIYEEASVKPAVVQNRFYPQTHFDVPLREFCRDHNIMYQSFWTLTGNPDLIQSRPVSALAQASGVDNLIALYALVMDLGVVVLNGTSSNEHMRQDLQGIKHLRNWIAVQPEVWAGICQEFKAIIKRVIL